MINSSRLMTAAFAGGLALTAIAAGSVFAQGAPGDVLPDGPAKATLTQVCTQCHALTVITARHRSPDEWNDVVGRMESMGASMDAGQKQTILAYLSANLGTGAPTAPAPSATDAAPAPAPSPTPQTDTPKR